MPSVCPTCQGAYSDILEHIRKKHPLEAYSDLQLQPLGLTRCPICSTACKGILGVQTHLAKAHKVAGASRVSTLPRANSDASIGSSRALGSAILAPDSTGALGPSRAPRRPQPSQLSRPRSPSPPPATPEARLPPLHPRNTGGSVESLPSVSVLLEARRAPIRPTSPLSPSEARGARNPLPELPQSPILSTSDSESEDEEIAILEPSRNATQVDNSAANDQLARETLAAIEGPRALEPSLEDQHRQALEPILQRGPVQTLISYARVPIPEERLHFRQAKPFIEAASRAAKAYIQQPTEGALLAFLLLPRVLGIALQKGPISRVLNAYPGERPPPPDPATPEPEALGSSDPAKKAMKWLCKGYISRAARALVDTAPLAPDTPENRAILREKHPLGPRNPFQNASPAHGSPISEAQITEALESISPEKAAGLSGWTRPLLDLAFRDPSVRDFFKLLANQIQQGTAPGADLLCAARLASLEKEDGSGIRPIAVGDIVYRLCTKAILLANFRPNMLLPSQLGVKSPGGVEPAIFTLEEAIVGPNIEGYKSIAALDLSNAFNSIGRASIAASISRFAPTFYKTAKWAYNRPSILVTPTGATIASTEGVRQGDPLGPLFFSLGFRPTLEGLARQLPQATIIAYQDDTYILNRAAGSPLQAAVKAFKGSPLSLNIRKSVEKPITALKTQGVAALGTFIGPYQRRRDFLQGKIAELEGVISSLKDLPKQAAFILLRASSSLLLRHLQRQLDPSGLADLWRRADSAIIGLLGHLTTRGPADQTPDLSEDLVGLAVRDGGLGLPSYSELAPGTYRAVKSALGPWLADLRQQGSLSPQAGPSRGCNGPQTPPRATIAIGAPDSPGAPSSSRDPPSPLSAREVYITANKQRLQRLSEALDPPSQRALLENASFLGRKWLGVLPTKKHLQLADPEFTEALRARLLVPVKALELAENPIAGGGLEGLCNSCGGKALLGHEDLCRGASRGWIQRHNQVTRAFYNTLSSRADLKVELEPPIGPDSEARADFSAQIGTSRRYFDVQIAAINAPSAKEEAYATLAEAAGDKRAKYRALGPHFEPLIFSPGGLMEKETAQAFKRLQGLIGPSASAYLSTTISLALLQTRARSAESIASAIRPRNRL